MYALWRTGIRLMKNILKNESFLKYRWVRVFVGAAIFFGVCILTLAAFDIGLHFTRYRYIIFTSPNGYFISNPDNSAGIAPDFPVSRMTSFDVSYDIWSNSLGCFDNPFNAKTDAPYLYLLGDSFVWGYAPFQDKWGTQIETRLGTRVLKCGQIHTGTAQEFNMLEEGLTKLPSPEMILVQYYENDPIDDYFYMHRLPHQDICVRNSLKGDKLPCWLFRNWFYHNSILYYLAIGALEEVLPHDVPQYIFQQNLENLQKFPALAKAHHSQLLIVLMPSKETVQENGPDPYETVRRALDEHGIHYLDLTQPFKEFYAATKAHLYWDHDDHINILGNKLAGLLVSQDILESKYIYVPDGKAKLTAVRQEIMTLEKMQ